MEFQKHLTNLSRPVMVEAVYLAGRYLTHALTRESFLRQLQADVKSKFHDESVRVVITLVDEIERSLKKPVNELPFAERVSLAAELDDVLWGNIDQQTDDKKIQDALAALRTQR